MPISRKLFLLLPLLVGATTLAGPVSDGAEPTPVESETDGELLSPVVTPVASPIAAESMGEGDTTSGSANESWYVYLGAGISSTRFRGDVQSVAERLSGNRGVQHLSLNFDLPGIYFPVNQHRTMIGPAWNFVIDRWSDSTASMQINQYLLGFSAVHFFGQNIGEGWYLRLDLGPAWYNVQVDIPGSGNPSHTSRAGWGTLLGTGFAFPISHGTRLLVGGHYTYRSVPRSPIGAFSFTAGLLY